MDRGSVGPFGDLSSLAQHTQGSRTRPGLHAVIRFADWRHSTGFTASCASRIGDIQRASRRRALRGFAGSVGPFGDLLSWTRIPRVRFANSRSRTHPGLHAVIRFADWRHSTGFTASCASRVSRSGIQWYASTRARDVYNCAGCGRMRRSAKGPACAHAGRAGINAGAWVVARKVSGSKTMAGRPFGSCWLNVVGATEGK